MITRLLLLCVLALVPVVSAAVAGGKAAISTDAPWMVALVDTSITPSASCLASGGSALFCQQVCGGVLIAPSWVMTAAHCYIGRNPADVKAVVGATNLNLGGLTAVPIASTLFHPDAPFRPNSSFRNDIALLKLATPSTATPASVGVDAAMETLDIDANLFDDEVEVFGWGQLGATSGFPSYLQRVALDLLRPECAARYFSYDPLVYLCAGELNAGGIEPDDEGDPTPLDAEGEDACTLDSGGPLIYRDNGEAMVAGLVSWGQDSGCGEAVYPGVYTRVPSYIGWLETTTANAGDPLADLGLQLNMTTDSPAGAPVTVSITLANNSVSRAVAGAGLHISGNGTALTFSSASGGFVCGAAGDGFDCLRSSGSLPAGATATAVFTVTGTADSTVLVTANTLRTAGQNDYRRANDTVSRVVAFTSQPDLRTTIDAAVTETAGSAGNTWLFVTVRNASTRIAATNVVLDVTLPAGHTLVESGTLGCLGTLSAPSCSLGTLPPGYSNTYRFAITTPAFANGTATASLSGSNGDFPTSIGAQPDSTSSRPVIYRAPSAVNVPPSVNVGSAQSTESGAIVHLDGQVGDSDGTVVSTVWTQVAGPAVTLSGANTTNAAFTAPVVADATLLTFDLAVSDDDGAQTVAQVTVTVYPAAIANLPPTANAGSNQTVSANALVTLNATFSDSDGSVVDFRWVQVAGPGVLLSDETNVTTRFVAPSLASTSLLTFNLVVTDNEGAQAVSTVTVTVNPVFINQAPNVNAGANQTVTGGTVVNLAGTFADFDGTVVSSQWTQAFGPTVTISNAGNANALFTAPTVTVQTMLVFTLTATDNNGAHGISQVTITVNPPPNIAPTVDAGSSQTITASLFLQLNGSASDADGSVASTVWTQTGGSPAVTLAGAGTLTPSFTAPTVAATTQLTFRLTVTDNVGTQSRDDVTVTVEPLPANLPPFVTAGANQAVASGTTVTLASTATDRDGSIAASSWTQLSGPAVTLAGASTATASFTAPAVAASTVLSFRVTATDNGGADATASVDVTVTPTLANSPPSASAGADQIVQGGDAVTLTGVPADRDGSVASVQWTQVSGTSVTLNNVNTTSASFTAPNVGSTTRLVFQFAVTDDGGAQTVDQVEVNVLPVLNRPPSVNAGASQNVNAGTLVSLSGSASDSDGTVASLIWLQVGGPTVTLVGANTATASFSAPIVSVVTTLTFQLTATDNGGTPASALVTVTVNPLPNTSPSVNAGADQSVSGGATVNLAGTFSDSDGTVVSSLWTLASGPAVTISNAGAANASFTAPAVVVATPMTFSLTVTDDRGASSVDQVTITVNPVVVPNVPPNVNAGSDQSVFGGITVNLNGTFSDSDGVVMSSLWTQAGGPTVVINNPSQAHATFTSPIVTAPTPLTFNLVVTDDDGVDSVDQIVVTVNPPGSGNLPPTVNAGADRSVVGGDSVVLAGTASDADGSIVSRLWTQTGGPAVSMVGTTTAFATFTAPRLAAVAQLTFNLTVTDNSGAQSVDQVVITVTPPATAGGGGKKGGALPLLTIALLGLLGLRRRRQRR